MKRTREERRNVIIGAVAVILVAVAVIAGRGHGARPRPASQLDCNGQSSPEVHSSDDTIDGARAT